MATISQEDFPRWEPSDATGYLIGPLSISVTLTNTDSE